MVPSPVRLTTAPVRRSIQAFGLFLILASAPTVLLAQQPDAPAPEEGRGFFMMGLHGINVDELNDQLIGAGYPTFSSTMFTLGGGGFGIRGSFLIGGEGHGLLGSDETTADGVFRTRLAGGYGMLNLGYDLFPGEPGSIYPLVGIGAGAMSLRIIEREALQFEDLLENPLRGVEASRVSFLLMFGLGGDYLFVPPGTPEDAGGLAVGVRVGYVAALGQTSWNTEVGDVAGGPKLSPSGAFVRFQIGGGSRPIR